jgi:hypothetical protein
MKEPLPPTKEFMNGVLTALIITAIVWIAVMTWIL